MLRSNCVGPTHLVLGTFYFLVEFAVTKLFPVPAVMLVILFVPPVLF
jgi:hypothetical protein